MSMDVKPWKCRKCGATMGMVKRNGSGVRNLLLYREAVAERDPVEVDVIAVVEGYAADVRCSVCGGMRTWVPGEEALERLIQQVEAMKGVRNGN